MSSASNGNGENPFRKYVDLDQPISAGGLMLRVGLPVTLIPTLAYFCLAFNSYEKRARNPTFAGYIKYVFTCFGRYSKEKYILVDEEPYASKYRPSRYSELPPGFQQSANPNIDEKQPDIIQEKFDPEGQKWQAEFRKVPEWQDWSDAEVESLKLESKPMESPKRMPMRQSEYSLSDRKEGRRVSFKPRHLSLDSATVPKRHPTHHSAAHTLTKPPKLRLQPSLLRLTEARQVDDNDM